MLVFEYELHPRQLMLLRTLPSSKNLQRKRSIRCARIFRRTKIYQNRYFTGPHKSHNLALSL